jgi:hypothetical protein
MKKKLVTYLLIFFLLPLSHLSAQHWNEYLQTGLGMGDYNGYKPCYLWGEYGLSYKGLDIGLALDYCNNNTPFDDSYSENGSYEYIAGYNRNAVWTENGENTYIVSQQDAREERTAIAVFLHIRYDLVSLLADNSRHHFKLGAVLAKNTLLS